MSSYYDEPTDSTNPLSNPRTVTIIVLAIAALVGIVGCVALYFFVNGNRGGAAGQATQVVAVTSLPSLTPSLTPIPTDTPAPTATVEEGTGGGGEATPDMTGTFASLPANRTAALDELRGLVQIRTDPNGSFQTVLSNVAIAQGTTVLTSENSSAKLTTTEGSIIRVSSQTQVTLTELSGSPTNPVTRLSLDFGKVWTIVGSPLGTGRFEVVTPMGTASVLGSWMSVEHNSTEGIDIITCLEGKCRYSNDEGVQEMVGGQQLVVKSGSPLPDPQNMDAAQVADWSITKVPEVITLTPTVTPTFTASVTHTPTATRTPKNTANVQQTSDKSSTNTTVAQTATQAQANLFGTQTQVAATSTVLAGSNSLTQSANSANSTATQNSANQTATVFFFNATATAFFNSTQNSFTATSFAFTATSFAVTSRYQATAALLTGTAQAVNSTLSAGSATASAVFATATANSANATGTSVGLTQTQAAIPFVNFDPASYATAIPESSGQVTLTVRIANPVSSNVNLFANFTNGTATGNSSLGSDGAHDYVNTTISFFIPANQTTTTISVPIADDGFAETNETFQVQLSCNGTCDGNPSNNGGARMGPNLTSTVTIVNSSAPTVGFTTGSPSVTEGDSGSANSNITVTLSRAYANTNAVSVNYSLLAGGTATGGGSCGYPTDYVNSLTDDDGGSPGVLNFPAGTTSRNIVLAVCGDNVNEGNETAFLQLTGPTNATLGTAAATFTIVDNDPLPSFTITTSPSPIAEPADATGNVDVTFTVALSATPGRDVTVQYLAQSGTAVSGVDYIPSSGTLTFLKDTVTLTQNVIVHIKGDALDENDETFSFVISNPTNATLGTTTSVDQTIQDDAGDGPPTIHFSNTPTNVAESGGGNSALDCNNNPSPNGQAYINVNMDAPSGKTVFINYATSDGAAKVPSDYFTTAGTLQFNPGEQCKSFLITIVNDNINEPTEDIVLTLSGPVNATITGTNPRQLFINDDDP